MTKEDLREKINIAFGNGDLVLGIWYGTELEYMLKIERESEQRRVENKRRVDRLIQEVEFKKQDYFNQIRIFGEIRYD